MAADRRKKGGKPRRPTAPKAAPADSVAAVAEGPAPLAEPAAAPPGKIALNYEHWSTLPPLLAQLRLSLLVSTYQAGQVIVISAAEGKLAMRLHNFDRAMGLAVRPGALAVGSRNQVWYLRAAPDIAPKVEPPGTHDGCYLARSAHFTGEIMVHEMAWSGTTLWVVNTLFSCLCTLDDRFSFVPRWRPPFVSALASEDRCHLNGLAMQDGSPRYVTALSQTDTPGGWREGKASGGCVIEVTSGRVVARGFAMPHSPRLHQGHLLVLDSGRGRLLHLDPANGTASELAQLPGYPRGMATYGRFAFIGLSRIRETATFGGLPLSEDGRELKCGVAVVDLNARRIVSLLDFKTGVEEIFDVQLLPMRMPVLSGPRPDRDEAKALWVVPPPDKTPALG